MYTRSAAKRKREREIAEDSATQSKAKATKVNLPERYDEPYFPAIELYLNDSSQIHWSQSSLLSIEAGPERAKFTVHKEILLEKAAYFRAALSGNFLEGQEDTLKWPDVDSQLLPLFIGWVYSGEIRNGPTDINFDTLAKLYVFADSHNILGLKNATADAIRHNIDETFQSATPRSNFLSRMRSLGYLWLNLPESDIVRTLVSGGIAYFMQRYHKLQTTEARKLNQLPKGLLIDCMRRLAHARQLPRHT